VDDSTSQEVEVLSFDLARDSLGFDVRVNRPLGELRLLGGMASADVDADGTDDLLVLTGSDLPALLLNDGEGAFSQASWSPALSEFASGPHFADVDGDLYPDLLVPNASDGSVALLLNDGGTAFTSATAHSGFEGDFAPALAAVAGDVDVDGDLDVFVARDATASAFSAAAGALWINDGSGQFTEQSTALDGLEVFSAVTSALFVDVNEDGRLDLLVGQGAAHCALWLNDTTTNTEPMFSLGDVGELCPRGALSLAAADFDNDSDFDLLAFAAGAVLEAEVGLGAEAGAPDAGTLDAGGIDAGAADAGSALDHASALTLGAPNANHLVHNGEDGFEAWPEESELGGPGGAAGCSADFNNDGLPDYFQAAMPSRSFVDADSDAGASSGVPGLYLQRRANPGTFKNYAQETGLGEAAEGRSVVCFDYDSDGDVDIFVVPFAGRTELHVNRLDPDVGPANYVGLRVSGSEEFPDVVGAAVTIISGATVQGRTIGQDRTAFGQAPDVLHFGVGSNALIDGIIVAWPDGAEATVLENLGANAVYTVRRQ
jgi:enediyne biosynthesis protein E4